MWFRAYTGDLGKKRLGRAKLTIKIGAGGRNRSRRQVQEAENRRQQRWLSSGLEFKVY